MYLHNDLFFDALHRFDSIVAIAQRLVYARTGLFRGQSWAEALTTETLINGFRLMISSGTST